MKLELINMNSDELKYNSTLGIIYMLLSAICFVIMNFATKLMYLSSNITPFETVGLRGLSMMIFNSIYANIIGVDLFKIPKEVALLLLIRTIIGTMGICLCFAANKVLPISIAGSLYYIYPLLTSFGGAKFLGEHVTKLEMLGMLLSFTGVLCIIYKPNSEYDLSEIYKYLLPISAAFVDSGVYLITRKIGTKIHCITTPAWFGSVQSILMAPIWMIYRSISGITINLTSQTFLYILMMCCGGCIGQILMNRALQLEKAGRMAAVNYIQIPLLFICDIWYFDINISLLVVLGSLLIISCSFITAILKFLGIYQ